MMFRSIRWRIASLYIVLILAIMAGLIVYLTDFVRTAYLADLQGQLQAEARLLGNTAEEVLAQSQAAESFDPLARHWSDLLGARVTLIGIDGQVLGESHEDRTQMDNHLGRPEVAQALSTGWGTSLRFSRTAGYDMLYGAVPVKVGDQVRGVVRVAVPLRQIDASVAHLRQTILLATLIAAGLAVLLAVLIAERTAWPVRQLTQVARRMSEGDLAARLIPATRDEVGTLTRAFNSMADELQTKVTTLDTERSRLAAVLEHMADGVLITDGLGSVRLINPAAARILDTTSDTALGHSFVEVVRDHRLVETWQQGRQLNQEYVATVEAGRPPLFVRVIVTPLGKADLSGCLVILQDLTQIRRLETVRRDFISNISHELRTPLASLKALVDTLRDGALDDPPAAQRFLDRIETEVDALTQIVQELLELSRIESGQVPLRLSPTPVVNLLLPPIDRLRSQAERVELSLMVDVPPDVPPVLADAERAQQVVTNLVHNAIKFTPSGGTVAVSAARVGDEVVISVRDTGVGISTNDLPRIFERFYKADRARSGGGTGLGLAIARHIVQAHGGRIWVDSQEGQGSTFYFSLPAVSDSTSPPSSGSQPEG